MAGRELCVRLGLGRLRAVQKQDGARQAVLFGQCAVRIGVAGTDQQQPHAATTEVGLQLRQFGGDEVAESALRAPVDDEHTLPAKVRERNRPPVEVGEAERPEGLTDAKSGGADLYAVRRAL